MPECGQCGTTFQTSKEDLELLAEISPMVGETKLDLPPPVDCFDCRQVKRLAQLNEMNLYKRTCSLTGKDIISNYHQECPYPVYEQESFYSDNWEPTATGREYDFNSPFFEQYQKLCLVAPRPALFTGYQYDENCAYTNYAGKNKDCYMIFDSDENWDCYYAFSINSCKSSSDSYRTRKSELVCECVDCVQCYNCLFAQDCENCSDSWFIKNCIGCRNCLMCSNLRNKEYYVENKPVSKEEFERFRAKLGNRVILQQAGQRFKELRVQFPQKALHGTLNEQVTGDYLIQCKNARHCFDSEQLWDCSNIIRAFLPAKNSMDCEEIGEAERCYECSCVGYNAFSVFFSSNCLDQINDLLYCTYCFHCKNCFGCVGLRRKEYCILNKQYTKEQYEELVPKIVEHMRENKEWGQNLPVQLAPFAYNETFAQDEYPLAKVEAEHKGYLWHEPDEKEFLPATMEVPEDIADTADSICDAILACSKCSRNYKITTQELKLHRQWNMPLHTRCFHCQHAKRRKARNPRTLYDRTCDKCTCPIVTTYAPGRPELVYCEECYVASVD